MASMQSFIIHSLRKQHKKTGCRSNCGSLFLFLGAPKKVRTQRKQPRRQYGTKVTAPSYKSFGAVTFVSLIGFYAMLRPRRTPFYSLQQSLNRRPNKNKKESAQNILYRSMFINPRYFQPAHIPRNCFRRAAKLLFSSELFLSCSVAEWL